jgi:Fic family protein
MAAERAPWRPHYTITPAIARGLMRIAAARAVVEQTPIPPAVAEELRRGARLRSTHFSTRIEGNRLTLEEAAQVIEGRTLEAPGRERDVREVQNYWNAFLRVEEWAAQKRPLSEDLIRRLHALVERGPRAKPTPYRDGQNVIRDSATGRIVYLPPTAEDVPTLLAALVDWWRAVEREELPIPLIAGLIHYQFATIHPYFDGNGRTARLLATLLLHRGGYGLNGIFSLEEYHARDLDAYYGALAVHPYHNYYEGRGEADLTPWLEYFAATLARVFALAEEEAQRLAKAGPPVEPEALRRLDARTKRVLALFAQRDRITAVEVARLFGFSSRAARKLLGEMVVQGVVAVADPSNRARTYQLSALHRHFIGTSSEQDP